MFGIVLGRSLDASGVLGVSGVSDGIIASATVVTTFSTVLPTSDTTLDVSASLVIWSSAVSAIYLIYMDDNKSLINVQFFNNIFNNIFYNKY